MSVSPLTPSASPRATPAPRPAQGPAPDDGAFNRLLARHGAGEAPRAGAGDTSAHGVAAPPGGARPDKAPRDKDETTDPTADTAADGSAHPEEALAMIAHGQTLSHTPPARDGRGHAHEARVDAASGGAANSHARADAAPRGRATNSEDRPIDESPSKRQPIAADGEAALARTGRSETGNGTRHGRPIAFDRAPASGPAGETEAADQAGRGALAERSAQAQPRTTSGPRGHDAGGVTSDSATRQGGKSGGEKKPAATLAADSPLTAATHPRHAGASGPAAPAPPRTADDRGPAPVPTDAAPTGMNGDAAAVLAAGGLNGMGGPSAAPSGPAAQIAVATALNQPQWAADFSRQFATLATSARAGSHTARLHVHPAELGPVHITLQIHDSVAQASFVSPHAQVRQALENALPALQQQLAQSGLSLGQADVSDQQAGQPGGQGAFDSQSGRDTGSPFGTRAAAPPNASARPLVSVRPQPRSDGRIDTFA